MSVYKFILDCHGRKFRPLQPTAALRNSPVPVGIHLTPIVSTTKCAPIMTIGTLGGTQLICAFLT
jgi:hypothetical protein